MNRRQFLSTFIILWLVGRNAISARAQPIIPFALRLVRRTGWEELMGRNKCIISDIYVSSPSFPVSDRGRKVCHGLELAWRNNINEISAVPKGDYEGFIRDDGPRGWRIELLGTGDRKNIQVHIGNRTADTIGCILPGTGDSADVKCEITGSRDAMTLLNREYGSSNLRKVVLRIE